MNDTEFARCALDFQYFVTKYIKVSHPQRGLIDFETYPYHERMIDAYSKHKFIVLKKFRQGGFTTTTLAWLVWKAIFQTDQQIVWVSKTDREAVIASSIVHSFIMNLPEWLAPVIGKDNAHEKSFVDTNSRIRFISPYGLMGIDYNTLVFDECAYIRNMEEHWKLALITASCGKATCIAISTPNGRGNWFEKTYTGAVEGINEFYPVSINYLEHPNYQSVEFAINMRNNLGLAGWTQEIIASFD